jgi:thioredoxin 1
MNAESKDAESKDAESKDAESKDAESKDAESKDAESIDFIETITEFKHEVMNEKLTIVEFSAEWCGPCKKLAPIFAEFATRYKDNIRCFRVDIDDSEKLADYCDIGSLPTIKFYKNGKELSTVTGNNPGKLGEMIVMNL